MPITQEQTFSTGHFFLLFFLSFFCVWCCGDDDTIFKLNRTEITCEDKFSRCPEQHPCTLYLIFYYGFYRFWMFFVWPVIEISYWAFLKNIRSARSRAFAFARLESWCVPFFLGCLRGSLSSLIYSQDSPLGVKWKHSDQRYIPWRIGVDICGYARH